MHHEHDITPVDAMSPTLYPAGTPPLGFPSIYAAFLQSRSKVSSNVSVATIALSSGSTGPFSNPQFSRFAPIFAPRDLIPYERRPCNPSWMFWASRRRKWCGACWPRCLPAA